MANDKDFDVEIKNAEVALSTTMQQLNTVRSQYVSAAIQFVSDWYMEHAEKDVTCDPKRAQSIGKEKITELKAAIKQLQQSAEQAINENLDDEWKSDVATNSYPPLTHLDRLEKAIRLAQGRLLAVLETVGGPFMYPRQSWQMYGSDDKRPYFSAGFDQSQKMITATREFDRLVEQSQKQAKQIDSVKRQKAKSEAADLWKNA